MKKFIIRRANDPKDKTNPCIKIKDWDHNKNTSKTDFEMGMNFADYIYHNSVCEFYDGLVAFIKEKENLKSRYE